MTSQFSSLTEVPGIPRGAPVLSVVVPCYNERPNVAPLISRLHEALRGVAWEVVYVDDNSPDGTAFALGRG